jgi:hypothetical protein
MSQWTQSARAKLEEYFARMRQTLQASGADVNEVVEDLRRHVEEEVTALKLVAVTEQDVGHILTRIGPPEAALATPPAYHSKRTNRTAKSIPLIIIRTPIKRGGNRRNK